MFAETIELEVGSGQFNLLCQAEDSECKCLFRRVCDREPCLCLLDFLQVLATTVLSLGKDRANAHVGKQEVDTGVALSAEHLIIRKYIALDGVTFQVRVLDRRYAHNLSVLLQFVLVHLHLAALFGHTLLKYLHGTLLSLIKHIDKLDSVSRSGLEFGNLSVFILALNDAELNVVQLGFLWIVELGELASLKDKLEMQFLTSVCHINCSISFHFIYSIIECSHVRGAIQVSSI